MTKQEQKKLIERLTLILDAITATQGADIDDAVTETEELIRDIEERTLNEKQTF